MIPIPTSEKDIIPFTNDLIETCRISQGVRAAYYRLLNTIAETGTADGTKSLINTMNYHLERTAAHLYSPIELKFSCDFDNDYETHVIKRGQVAAKHLTRQWEKTSTDIMFGHAVFESLKYGLVALKQWPKTEGPMDDERIS